jgi:hypothetical protein
VKVATLKSARKPLMMTMVPTHLYKVGELDFLALGPADGRPAQDELVDLRLHPEFLLLTWRRHIPEARQQDKEDMSAPR